MRNLYITTNDLIHIAINRLREVETHVYPDDKIIWVRKAKELISNVEKNIIEDIAAARKARGEGLSKRRTPNPISK